MTPRRATQAPVTRALLATTAALAVLATVAACGGSKAASSPSPSVASVAPTTTATTTATSPFTGLPMTGTGGSVLAVKIDNTPAALPHIGLTSADVVYIEQVEGGLTRIAAIYASKKPKEIAPIRSARETDAELLPTYGQIPLAFSGSVAAVHAAIKAAGLIDVSEDKGGLGYYRLNTRFAPYNLAGNPKVLTKRGGTAVHPRDIGLVFGPLPTTGGRPATKLVETFPAARIGFKYDPATNRYVYSLNGTVDKVPGLAANSATTVVIQYVKIGSADRGDKLSHPVPFTHTIGSGKALVARDGMIFKVTWSRASADAPTKWTYNGADFPMGAGQPWIILAPKSSPVKVTYTKVTSTPSATPTN